MSAPAATREHDNGGGGHVGPETIPIDEEGWWQDLRLTLLLEVLDDGPARVERHIDVGCGRASLASALADRGAFVVATDAYRFPEWDAAAGKVRFVQALADQLPFRDGAFDRATATDVIEHLADDAPALTELQRITRLGGDVVVTVPAEPWLWSEHDVRVGHFRRYRSGDLRAALARAGLPVGRLTHFFSWLVPPALLLKRARGRLSGDEVSGLPVRIMARVAYGERWWLRRANLPVGTSLLAVARRAADGDSAGAAGVPRAGAKARR